MQHWQTFHFTLKTLRDLVISCGEKYDEMAKKNVSLTSLHQIGLSQWEEHFLGSKAHCKT